MHGGGPQEHRPSHMRRWAQVAYEGFDGVGWGGVGYEIDTVGGQSSGAKRGRVGAGVGSGWVGYGWARWGGVEWSGSS